MRDIGAGLVWLVETQWALVEDPEQMGAWVSRRLNLATCSLHAAQTQTGIPGGRPLDSA
jgi:hypothetical protein